MSESESQQTSNGRKAPPPADWDSWPTATEAAKRAGVTRPHVYRLAEAGELEAVEGYQNGRRVLRFSPDSIDLYAASKGEPVLETGTEDTLTVRLLSEARQIASDARKGMHEAYGLVSTPARELCKEYAVALKAANERIRELEERLYTLHDEQRDTRREDREWQSHERRQAAQDARKDQVLEVLKGHAPTIIDQLSATLTAKRAGAASPVLEPCRTCRPSSK